MSSDPCEEGRELGRTPLRISGLVAYSPELASTSTSGEIEGSAPPFSGPWQLPDVNLV
jgi:hypothetical protein